MTPTDLDRRGLLRTAGVGALALAAGTAALDATAPEAHAATAKTLRLTWRQQPTTYYCGPTAASFAVAVRTGGKPDINAIARRLGTTTAGTNFGAMAPGLTALVPGGTYRAENMIGQQDATPAQVTALWNRARKNVLDGYGTVCNWVVPAGHYPNWGGNTGTIWHFTTIIGFDDAKKTLTIADPAGATLSSKLPHTYALPVGRVATLCADRGYFW